MLFSHPEGKQVIRPGILIAGIVVFCLVFKQISRRRWLIYAFSGKALLKIIDSLTLQA
ncbi:hypothetical protein ACV822_001121 [Klebsiella aerogenes]|uniref:hypothetical protein n=1 Tax=Klebsiella aerogenes TaxID=548 RepID=UPI0027FF42D3|nr:hypothetical protein [Klebsiella aerogenes]HCR0141156.1 hypothetical protein [Klebsiella aerogenes]HDU6300479.1 hypothetical protein [Klebsiella aerogenes]